MILVNEINVIYAHDSFYGCRLWSYNNDKDEIRAFLQNNNLKLKVRKITTKGDKPAYYCVITPLYRERLIKAGAVYADWSKWVKMRHENPQLTMF